MSKQTIQPLNLIVVSPGDVQPEREAMDAVVADLNRIISSRFGLELRVLRWETDAYPAFHLEGPQAQVDEALQIDDCDIMVGIFWKRFGTPVRDAGSGTEHELGRAYTAWKGSGGKRPQSRSRDVNYLKAIEQKLQAVPALVHHRVLSSARRIIRC